MAHRFEKPVISIKHSNELKHSFCPPLFAHPQHRMKYLSLSIRLLYFVRQCNVGARPRKYRGGTGDQQEIPLSEYHRPGCKGDEYSYYRCIRPLVILVYAGKKAQDVRFQAIQLPDHSL